MKARQGDRRTGNQHVQDIFISAKDGVSTTKVKADIERLIRERRHIADDEDDNFNVQDIQEIMSTVTGTTRMPLYPIVA